MIKTIRLSNFQSHKKTTIDLNSGVNAIVGLSDSGKSALFRALRWVLTNKPQGDSFRSHWGGTTVVEIELDDGTIIRREKGKDNVYYLNDEEFRGFKGDVPEPIAKVLNIDFEINLQTQLEAPFLLADSSSEVAKILNRFANLSDIDTTLSNIRRRTNQVKNLVLNSKEEIETYESDLKEFDYLQELEKDIKQYESLVQKQNTLISQISTLEDIIFQAEGNNHGIAENECFLEAENPCNQALKKVKLYEQLEKDVSYISNLCHSIEQQQEKIARIGKLLKAEAVISKVEKAIDEYKRIEKQRKNLYHLIFDTENQERGLDCFTSNLKYSEQEYKKLMSNRCPLCGTKLKGGTND